MVFFIPLLLLGGSILADYLFQQHFENEERKRQEQYLARGFTPEQIIAADVYGEGEEGLEGEGEDPGAAYLRRQLFG